MTVWMYFTTDNDSGFYNIRLFSTREKAEEYKRIQKNPYGNVRPERVE